MKLHAMPWAAALMLSTACTASDAETPSPAQSSTDDLASQVLTREKSTIAEEAWGRFITYSEGTTFGTMDSLTGVAEINPGQQIHPPHVHAEEEYLMVLEGTGEWHLNGRDFPAKAGDMIYARPWDIHGIKNTGETVMKFVVWKWNSKGITPLPAPTDLLSGEK